MKNILFETHSFFEAFSEKPITELVVARMTANNAVTSDFPVLDFFLTSGDLDRRTFSADSQEINTGKKFERLIIASIVIASRCNTVYGSQFSYFLSFILQELIASPDFNSRISIEYDQEFPNQTLIPFLSPMPGFGWNQEFLNEFENITPHMNVGIIFPSVNQIDRMDFYISDRNNDKVILGGECKNWRRDLKGADIKTILKKFEEGIRRGCKLFIIACTAVNENVRIKNLYEQFSIWRLKCVVPKKKFAIVPFSKSPKNKEFHVLILDLKTINSHASFNMLRKLYV